MSSWAPLKMECHQAKTTCYHQTVLNSLQKPLWCHQAAKKSEAVAVNCSGGSGRTGAVISSHYHLSLHFGDRCNVFPHLFIPCWWFPNKAILSFWSYLVILLKQISDVTLPCQINCIDLKKFHIHDTKLLLFLVKHCFPDEDSKLNLDGDFILSLCLLWCWLMINFSFSNADCDQDNDDKVLFSVSDAEYEDDKILFSVSDADYEDDEVLFLFLRCWLLI